MPRILIIGFAVVFLIACESLASKRQSFENSVNKNIGMSANFIFTVPKTGKLRGVEIRENEKGDLLYSTSLKSSKCRYLYVVDKKTNIIKGWHYVSSPDECYVTGGSWFGSY